MAYVPDFGSLATQQTAANDAAANKTNLANRPNQSGPMGSSTWTMGPDGQWTQSSALTGGAQGLFDSTMSGQQGLSSQIGAGLNFGNAPAMPTVGGYNQQVIDSWNALQAPQLAQSEAAARQRLAAQGVTNGSRISNTSEQNLGNVRTDAGNKAILAGYTQGNTEFDQALRARAQGTGEAKDAYSAAVSGMGALTTARNSLNPNEWQSKVPTSVAYTPTSIYGAAQDTFNANMQNENASRASSQASVDSGVNALRAAGGIGGITSGLGGLWSGATNAYNWLNTPSGGWDAWNYGNNGGGDSLGDFGSNLGLW